MAHEKLVVVGQGYVGLPIAMRAVQVGFDVVGLDVDTIRVEALQQGRSFVEDVSDDDVASAIATGRFRASTRSDALEGFDHVIITVPTPLKESIPDLSFMQQAADTIGPFVTPGSTVVLESTTYPGTTEELLVPALENASGLKAGPDFFVGYSPERIDPGNQTYTFVTTPKVVAGIDAASTAQLESLYGRLVDTVVPVATPKEAELTKLLENTFRHVNIALVNELAVYAHSLDIDVWEAIEAAATKPFGFMKFTPGPGVGGHCLPVDPSYLSWQVRRTLGQNFRFVELANDVNDHMPDYVVQRVMSGLNKERKALNGSRVLAIGLSYKKNTGDPRESPAMRVVELLHQAGAEVHAVDPYVEDHLTPGYIHVVDFSEDELRAADAVVVLTDHDNLDYDLIASAPGFVLDTRHRLGGRRESI
ncbi:UDP-N-acetyl-D-glucosamine dehydrogenase [Marmoricola endophyticus]|uniref:UDP-N-acetyl-D-glucosamine dehydrogenase n=1 Tax=Marmoricola endophyticus TaxID=2040280 RepID=A0A917BHX2_9ACTN|nr:nucleotide sugar dehydrogenase [Marmoricola endophyticus]GGF43650.1 UDP-N-acetyl-D-glucosamine dehydrogenase [Marmoricola endophyticus]